MLQPEAEWKFVLWNTAYLNAKQATALSDLFVNVSQLGLLRAILSEIQRLEKFQIA